MGRKRVELKRQQPEAAVSDANRVVAVAGPRRHLVRIPHLCDLRGADNRRGRRDFHKVSQQRQRTT